MGRPTTYNREAALIVARHVAEGGSFRGVCKLLPSESSRLTRWKSLHPEFRALIELAAVIRTLTDSIGDFPYSFERGAFLSAMSQALHAPPGELRDGMWRYVEKAGRAGGALFADELLEEFWNSELNPKQEDQE